MLFRYFGENILNVGGGIVEYRLCTFLAYGHFRIELAKDTSNPIVPIIRQPLYDYILATARGDD